MPFYGNQLSWAIKHLFISLCFKYYSLVSFVFLQCLPPLSQVKTRSTVRGRIQKWRSFKKRVFQDNSQYFPSSSNLFIIFQLIENFNSLSGQTSIRNKNRILTTSSWWSMNWQNFISLWVRSSLIAWYPYLCWDVD